MPSARRSFAFLVRDVSRLNAAVFARASGELNLTLPQCRVLVQLEHNEGSTQAQLAELTETEPMTLVRLLDRMEQDQWIERRQDERDRRSKRIYLLPAAEPILERIHRFSDQVQAKSLAGVRADERKQLMAWLERIHRNLMALDESDSAGKSGSKRS